MCGLKWWHAQERAALLLWSAFVKCVLGGSRREAAKGLLRPWKPEKGDFLVRRRSRGTTQVGWLIRDMLPVLAEDRADAPSALCDVRLHERVLDGTD